MASVGGHRAAGRRDPGQALSTSREEAYLHSGVPCSFCTEAGISEAGRLLPLPAEAENLGGAPGP